MELSQSGIAELHFFALALGFVLGLFFDLLRFPRMLFAPGVKKKPEKTTSCLRKRPALGVAVFLEDFLFCLVAAVCTILLFYEHNFGKIRLFSIALLFVGFFLYWQTLGRLVRKLLVVLSKWFRKAVRKLLGILWVPVRKVLLDIKTVARRIWNAFCIWQAKRDRKKETAKLFEIVERNAAGLLPGGLVLKKQETKQKRSTHGRRKRKKDHCPKQESVA